MKLFVKNIIWFFMILYLSILTILTISNYIINSKADFRLQENINKIVIGNSHPAGTFNDSLITNFKNLADPGECYFYSYLKLKEFLKHNPQVDTVFVELYPITITKREDKKLWRKHQIPNYLPFLGIEDHLLLAKEDNIAYQQELAKGILNNLKRITLNQYHYTDSLGGFRHVKSSRLKEILASINYNPKIQYTLDQVRFSNNNISYLDKMIKFCEDQNVQFIFVRSPYHNLYDAHKYEDIFQTFRKKQYPSIPFWDFNDFNADDSEFKDPQHLNHIGARKFSLWFEERIKTIKKGSNF